jgi:hypothetical protein
MKVKKPIKKFRILEQRIREYLTEFSPTNNNFKEIEEVRKSLMKKRPKNLCEIFQYAPTH